jgi:hypothetical protein
MINRVDLNQTEETIFKYQTSEKVLAIEAQICIEVLAFLLYGIDE